MKTRILDCAEYFPLNNFRRCKDSYVLLDNVLVDYFVNEEYGCDNLMEGDVVNFPKV